MRYSLLSLAVAGLSLSPLAQAEFYDARAFARGGTGMTMGEYNQALYNPALLARFDEKDEFSFAVNVAALVSDQDKIIDDIEDAQDAIDALEASPSIANANTVRAQITALDSKLVQIGAGGSAMIGIPNSFLPLAFVVRGSANAGAQFLEDAGDTAVGGVIDQIAAGAPGVSQDDLNSRVVGSGVAIIEGGLMTARNLTESFSVGGTLKFQNVQLLNYDETVGNFDEEDVIDSDDISDDDHINLDLGATWRIGKLVVAGTLENLIAEEFDTVDPDTSQTVTYEMDPVATAAVGYAGDWIKAEASVDLTDRNGFVQLPDAQYARIGVELSAGRHLHLRAGYRSDLEDNYADIFTAGLGITPFDRLNIDLAGAIGEGDTFGAALQIGFKI